MHVCPALVVTTLKGGQGRRWATSDREWRLQMVKATTAVAVCHHPSGGGQPLTAAGRLLVVRHGAGQRLRLGQACSSDSARPAHCLSVRTRHVYLSGGASTLLKIYAQYYSGSCQVSAQRQS